MLKNYKARERQTKGCVATAQTLYVPAQEIEEVKSVNLSEVYVSAHEIMEQKRNKKANYRKDEKRRDVARKKARMDKEINNRSSEIAQNDCLYAETLEENIMKAVFELCEKLAEKKNTEDTIELLKELGYYTWDIEKRIVKDEVYFTKEEEISLRSEILRCQ